MSRFRAVLFDFDYTLADSSRGVVECINYAFRGMGLSKASPEEIRRTIGLSLPNILMRLAGVEHAERSREFGRLFLERADEVMADLTRVFDDVPEVIGHLKDGGLALGIVSTKFRYRIADILERHASSDCFDVIVGGEDVSMMKPDPKGIYMASDRLGVKKKHSVYLGDSLTDAETAKRAHIDFIAVLSGTTTRDEFRPYPVRRVIHSITELPFLLNISENGVVVLRVKM